VESQATVADRVREILKEQGCGEFGQDLAHLVDIVEQWRVDDDWADAMYEINSAFVDLKNHMKD